MNRILYPPHRWVRLGAIVATLGLLLALSRCELSPILGPLPGSKWEISDTVYTVVDTVLVRTPSHGTSLSLYAGQTDAREAGFLIKFKFTSVDSSRLANFQSARLVLFRRTFGADTLPDPSLTFNLSTIAAQANDTIWSETDTAGHTELDLLETMPESTASMSTDSIAIPSGDSTIIRTDLEYLAFRVYSTTLSDWAWGEVANNGFLIRQEGPGTLVGFYSRGNVGLSPYLALTITDTASTSGDTTFYYWATGDISIYPSQPDNSVFTDGLLHLDHSSGLRSHIKFNYDHRADTTRIVAGARLILQVNQSASRILANQVNLRVRHRAVPIAEGDSLVTIIDRITYHAGSDSFTVKLGSYVNNLELNVFGNHGLDLLVLPWNHDFDNLVFWGSTAQDSLDRPRLEIIYGLPFSGGS